jgi:hypothetical protein
MLYWQLLEAQVLPALLLTIRNALVVVLLVWSIVRLARVPRRMSVPADALLVRS